LAIFEAAQIKNKNPKHNVSDEETTTPTVNGDCSLARAQDADSHIPKKRKSHSNSSEDILAIPKKKRMN